MLRKAITRWVVGGLMMTAALIGACNTTEAQPSELTGNEGHMRHDTGIDSHSAD